jgi:hypothetical protein
MYPTFFSETRAWSLPDPPTITTRDVPSPPTADIHGLPGVVGELRHERHLQSYAPVPALPGNDSKTKASGPKPSVPRWPSLPAARMRLTSVPYDQGKGPRHRRAAWAVQLSGYRVEEPTTPIRSVRSPRHASATPGPSEPSPRQSNAPHTGRCGTLPAFPRFAPSGINR